MRPQYVDGFGNRVHLITHCKPYERADDHRRRARWRPSITGGVLGDLGEAANPLLFLRATPLHRSSSERSTRWPTGCRGKRMLDRLHHLLEAIAARVAYVTDATHRGDERRGGLRGGAGASARTTRTSSSPRRAGCGIPARYVTGYLHRRRRASAAVANHAWAEACVAGLGWVGFDPANHICPTERYVRLACGFDAASAAPIAGTRRGGGAEALRVDVIVRQQQQ